MNNKSQKKAPKGTKAIIICFFVTLFAGACVALYLPLRPTYSEAEKRELAKFPEFTFSSLFDGSYFNGISTWYADTFPWRDMFMNANVKIKSFYGFGDDSINSLADGDADDIPEIGEAPAAPITLPDVEDVPEEEKTEDDDGANAVVQNLGAVLIVDDSAYEYYSFSRDIADKYASTINTAAAQLKGKARVFDIIVPTSTDITLSASVRKGLNSSDQKKAIDYMYSVISSDAIKVNAFDSIYAHREEYIYFRTDHHWTARGAYYAYSEYSKAAGIRPAALTDFEEKDFGEFVGAFYNDTDKNPALEKNPDKLIAYAPKGNVKLTFTDSKGSKVNWNVVTDVSDWKRGAKYSAFIGGDNPYTHIVNSDITDGSSCVVIKESFGNAFVPFLTANYSEIHVIDYRYWSGNLSQFVTENGVDDVVFVNNISATRNKSLVNKMGKIL